MINNFTRKPNRLPISQVYGTNNSFFVTVCVRDKICCLSGIANESINTFPTINLTSAGKIVKESWLNLPNLFENIALDEFVVMLNHFHGIIIFLDTPIRKSNEKEVNLSEIISTFKSLSWRNINKKFVEEPLRFHKEYELLNQNAVDLYNGNMQLWNDKHSSTKIIFPSFWQKSFYDHVIRNEKDYERVREYIYENPVKWEVDILNLEKEGKY